MSQRSSLGALVALAASMLCSKPAASEELRMVVGSWCPFECTEQEAGGLRGFVTDIATAVVSEQGVEPVLVYASFARGIDLVRQGQAQVLVGIEKRDAPDLIYPEVEQAVAQNAFFVRAGDPWRYQDLDSVARLATIGILKPVDYAEVNELIARHPEKFAALPAIVDAQHANARRNLKRLLAGRLDAFIQHRLVVQFELERMGMRGALQDAGPLRDPGLTYVAFSPLFPDAERYAELMSRGTERLRASGELAKILERYGLSDWKSPPAAQTTR